jgi:hypothetical protein
VSWTESASRQPRGAKRGPNAPSIGGYARSMAALGWDLSSTLSATVASPRGHVAQALHRRAPGAGISAMQRWHSGAAGSVDTMLHGMRGDAMVPGRECTGGGTAVRRW